MLKKTVIAFALPLLSLLVISLVTPPWRVSAQTASQTARSPQQAGSAVATTPGTGTIQKMIVENGSVTMDLDVSRLNGAGSATQNLQAHFAVGANSFFPVLVFNDLLRGPLPGSRALVPQNVPALPGTLGASLKQPAVEKLPSGQGFDLAVRDSNTGFTFFNIEGHQYDYNPAAQSLAISNGRLLIS